MGRLNVKPNKMELILLKKRLKTANRGHKLLSDKQSELVKHFIALSFETKSLREEVEREISQVMKDFLMARALMSNEVLEEAILIPPQIISLNMSINHIMSVETPQFQRVYTLPKGLESSQFSYGYANTSVSLDLALSRFLKLSEKMVALAQAEKTCQLMAGEIEKTRRRVNVLEYVMVPQLEETVKYISGKLDENERGSKVRLMKLKGIVQKKRK